MTSLLTCKEFLQELTDYLDEPWTPNCAASWRCTLHECPNCFVILDTTQKTIQVYKGMQPQDIPQEVQARLMKAVERKMAAAKARTAVSTEFSIRRVQTSGAQTSGRVTLDADSRSRSPMAQRRPRTCSTWLE